MGNPIQPGVGYGFNSSGFGISLNTAEPFIISTPETLHPFQVRYIGGTAYVRSGMVNNVLLDDQEFPVPSTGTHYIYIECHAAAAPTEFPTSVTCDFGASVPSNDSSTGYVLIATIVDGVVAQQVSTSLNGQRNAFENPETTLYYFWRV